MIQRVDDVLRGIFVRREELPFCYSKPHDVGFVVFQGVLHDGGVAVFFHIVNDFLDVAHNLTYGRTTVEKTVEFGVSHLR